MSSSVYVLLPEDTPGQIGMDGSASDGMAPCLYLLHGLSDDESIWLRRTSIERYVAPLGLAVIMPNVHRSFYTNMACGERYWDFVSEELPQKMESLFRLSTRRADRFAAGLSMGGYGALKLGLRRPDRYAAAASLSGVSDIAARALRAVADGDLLMRWVFGEGDGPAGTADDLFALAEKVAARPPAERPALYQWCGREDGLLAENARFREHAARLGLALTAEDGPGGHTWDCWDRQIQRVLEWLPLRRAQ